MLTKTFIKKKRVIQNKCRFWKKHTVTKIVIFSAILREKKQTPTFFTVQNMLYNVPIHLMNINHSNIMQTLPSTHSYLQERQIAIFGFSMNLYRA